MAKAERGLDRAWVRQALSGPMTSIHPLFSEDGSLDARAIDRHIDFALEAGSGTMLLTYGDSLHSILSDREVGDLLRIVIRATAGRAMVVAADRQWPTRIELEFAREVRDAGADLLMVLPPNWGRSATVDSFVDHYRAVAAEIPAMVVTAAFSGIETIGLEVLRILVESEPRMVALKDDICGDFAKRVATLCHPAWAIISGGQKQNHLDLVPYGVDGYMSTFIHFNPSIAHRYWELLTAGELAAVAALIDRYDRPYFDRIMVMPGGFDGGFHATLEAAGLADRWRRAPYYNLTDAEYDEFAGFLQDTGMLMPPTI